MKFGKAIREARIRKGLRQYELAEKIGVTKQNISLWETDKNTPSPQNWQRLERVLETTFRVVAQPVVEKQYPIPNPVKVEFWDDIDLMGFTILTCTIWDVGGDFRSKSLGGSILLESSRKVFEDWFTEMTGMDYEDFINEE